MGLQKIEYLDLGYTSPAPKMSFLYKYYVGDYMYSVGDPFCVGVKLLVGDSLIALTGGPI